MANFNKYGDVLNSLVICSTEFIYNSTTKEGIVKYYKLDLAISDSFDKLLFLICTQNILLFEDLKCVPSIVMNYLIQKYPECVTVNTLNITDNQNCHTQISKLHNYNYFYSINMMGTRDITKGIQKIRYELIKSLNLLPNESMSP
jgi:hypothetical protein